MGVRCAPRPHLQLQRRVAAKVHVRPLARRRGAERRRDGGADVQQPRLQQRELRGAARACKAGRGPWWAGARP